MRFLRFAKLPFLLVLMCASAAGAGFAVARLTARAAPALTPMPPALRGSVLSDELQLTPEQTAKMRPIWEAARDTARSCAEEARRVEREHDDRLRAMLPDAQRAEYQRLSEEDHSRIAALDARRKQAFRKAVDLTERILSEDQKQVYQRIISDQVGTQFRGE